MCSSDLQGGEIGLRLLQHGGPAHLPALLEVAVQGAAKPRQGGIPLVFRQPGIGLHRFGHRRRVEIVAAAKEETTFYDYWGTGNNKAEIYIEEKDYDKLFGYLSALEYRRLDALLQYASHLNATHSSQILPLFTDDLRTYAEKNLGRNHYEYIARVLRGMRKLNGGKEAVKQLVEEFRILYKRRSAMMQELGEF